MHYIHSGPLMSVQAVFRQLIVAPDRKRFRLIEGLRGMSEVHVPDICRRTGFLVLCHLVGCGLRDGRSDVCRGRGLSCRGRGYSGFFLGDGCR